MMPMSRLCSVPLDAAAASMPRCFRAAAAPAPNCSMPTHPRRPTARCRRSFRGPQSNLRATPPGARPGHVARCRRGRRSHGAAALPLLAAAVAIWIEMRWGVGLGAGARGIGAWWAKLGRASLDRVWHGT